MLDSPLGVMPEAADCGSHGEGLLAMETHAMATTIKVQAHGAASVQAAESAISQAFGLCHQMESACTRFDPSSPLMRANAAGEGWVSVPRLCYDALVDAESAHRATRGRFDPRVLGDLVGLGYDSSFVDARKTGVLRARPAFAGPWQPGFRGWSTQVRIGAHPVDLGGIGKGLAVRWASSIISKTVGDFLMEAGGDCYCAGSAPDSGPWMIGVENPFGGASPVAVLGLRDRAVATSSTRVRRWAAVGGEAHHLIDPHDGRPGGKGLVSVTVVGRDPARAEVWSKVAFLEGRDGIEHLVNRKGLAAAWIDAEGRVSISRAMQRYVAWRPL